MYSILIAVTALAGFAIVFFGTVDMAAEIARREIDQ